MDQKPFRLDYLQPPYKGLAHLLQRLLNKYFECGKISHMKKECRAGKLRAKTQSEERPDILGNQNAQTSSKDRPGFQKGPHWTKQCQLK